MMSSSVAQFAEWIASDVDNDFEVDEHLWYLSGPMTGYPDFNFSLFQRAAKTLREKGFQIVSPSEMDESQGHWPWARRPKWGAYLGRDVTVIIEECDGIIMLPKWRDSPGCRIELFVALTQGHATLEFKGGQVLGLHRVDAMLKLTEQTLA